MWVRLLLAEVELSSVPVVHQEKVKGDHEQVCMALILVCT